MAALSKSESPEGDSVGSNPTAPATIYVDAETGQVVSESWWPGMPHDSE